MNFSQRKIRFLARLLLAAGLFAQGTLAAHACVTPVDSTAMVHAAVSVAESMPCHEVEKPNANACLMHCTQASQVSLDHQAMVAPPMTEAVLQVAMPQLQHTFTIAAHTPELLNTGPPLSIRYCSFLI